MRILFSSSSLRKAFARFANLDLLPPVFMDNAPANGAINEPAQVSCLELPCRTLTLLFKGAFLLNPAGLLIFSVSIDPGE